MRTFRRKVLIYSDENHQNNMCVYRNINTTLKLINCKIK